MTEAAAPAPRAPVLLRRGALGAALLALAVMAGVAIGETPVSPLTVLAVLADRLGLSRGTVQSRLAALAQAGAFRGYDRALDPAVAGFPLVAFTTLRVQQRMLAETWVEASNATDDAAHGRVRLITDAAQAAGGSGSAEDAEIDAPWLRRSTVSDLLATRPIDWDHKLRYPAAARDAELSPEQLSRLKRFSGA